MDIANKSYLSYLGFFIYVLLFISEIINFFNDDISSLLKMFSLGMIWLILIVNIIFLQKFPKWIFFGLFLLSSFFFFDLVLTKNINMYMEELIRYTIPVSMLLWGYFHRKYISIYINIFLIIVILFDVVQIGNYIMYYLFNIKINGYYHFLTKGVLRGTGPLGFEGMAVFGFINFSAFWISRISSVKFLRKFKNWFLVFAILSFSFKLYLYLFIGFIIYNGSRKIIKTVLLTVFAIIIFLQIPVIKNALNTRLTLYILENASARADSYRVMYESISKEGNILMGEGVGAFGGPASTKYKSDVYSKYNFNWGHLKGVLKTTDTYFPHLFVELGFVPAIIYLMIFFFVIKGDTDRINNKIIKILLIGILIDSLFSFAFNAFLFCASSLFFFYGIKELGKQGNNPNDLVKSEMGFNIQN